MKKSHGLLEVIFWVFTAISFCFICLYALQYFLTGSLA